MIDGWGFVFWNGLMQSLPFRNQRAAYSYGKTFIERSNVGGDYGDNQQAFYMTAAQRDWSLGQSRSHFDPTTPEGSRMFYSSQGIDPTVEGQITLAGRIVTQSTLSSAFTAGVTGPTYYYSVHANSHLVANGVTDLGAHGLGTATVTIYGMCNDDNGIYMTSTSAGTVGIRRHDILSTAFSTFSATACDSIAYNANTLYGAINSTAELASFSTAGVKTSLFVWKDAAGTARKQTFLRLLPYGGNLLILLQAGSDRAELWLHDGTSTYIVAKLPRAFQAYDMVEEEGVVFLSGQYFTSDYTGAAAAYISAIFSFVNGNLTEPWKPAGPIDSVGLNGAATTTQQNPAIVGWHGTLLFTWGPQLMRYDTNSGAVYSLGGISTGNTPFLLVYPSSVASFVSFVSGSTGWEQYNPGQAATTGQYISSQFDFNSSLQKYMHGVTILWSGPAGTSVDIQYQLNNAGSYTLLKSGAVSGTEYTVNQTARSLALLLTLHGSGSANFDAPTVTRTYIRAAPLVPPFRRCQYVLDLTGTNDQGLLNDPVPLRDGTYSTLTGAQMATNLVAAITSSTPITITDRFGTYTAVFEQGEGITELDEVRPAEFVAQVTAREV